MANGKFVWHTTPTGKYRFNLVAGNGQVIATSENYASKDSCMTGIESVRKNAGSHVEDQTVDGYKEITNPKYEIYLDKAKEYRFRLKARNGENIAASEGYTTKASCVNGIESVKKHAPDAALEEAK